MKINCIIIQIANCYFLIAPDLIIEFLSTICYNFFVQFNMVESGLTVSPIPL